MRWKKVIGSTGHISALITIVCIFPLLAQILGQGSDLAPWDEMASWSLFLSISCLATAGRSSIGRIFLVLSALGLLFVNGYLSEAILKPLFQLLSTSFDLYYWKNSDLDVLLIALLPFVLSVATLLEAKTRAVESPQFRRATLLGLVWGGICLGLTTTTTATHRGYGEDVFVIASLVTFGVYLYHLALAQLHLLKAMRNRQPSTRESSLIGQTPFCSLPPQTATPQTP